MADVVSPSPIFSINAASNYPIGNGSDSTTSTLVIQGTSVSFSGTGLVVKARAHGTTQAWVPIPYVRRSLAGAASDDTVVSAALSGSFLIKIDATGLEISLDNSTGYTSGSFTIGVTRSEGAAA